jgi:broad specificity phosphatase PhoE
MMLYFVRHGESEANTLGVISNRGLRFGLTDTGRQQAAALAEKLGEIRFANLHTRITLAIRTRSLQKPGRKGWFVWPGVTSL